MADVEIEEYLAGEIIRTELTNRIVYWTEVIVQLSEVGLPCKVNDKSR